MKHFDYWDIYWGNIVWKNESRKTMFLSIITIFFKVAIIEISKSINEWRNECEKY